MNQTGIDNVLVFIAWSVSLGTVMLGVFLASETLEKLDGFKDYLTKDFE